MPNLDPFIVVGMHRSGTSLVARLLIALGVHMGDDLLGPGPGNPDGHYEDVEFYHLNQTILRQAGGSWDYPPTLKAILAAGQAATDTITALVDRKAAPARVWGWKDPRTTLTLPCYTPHLAAPKLVIVTRDMDQIIASLIKRSGSSVEKWYHVCKVYALRLITYGLPSQQDYPTIIISYNNLVNPLIVDQELYELADFVGRPDVDVGQLKDMIRLRQEATWVQMAS